MFIIIQYPFIDFRLTLNDYQNKENVFFPNLKANSYFDHYYRYLGAINNRKKQIEIPFSERKYYNSRAFTYKFENITGKIVFQRMYNDGLFFHYDIGMHFPDNEINGNFFNNLFNAVSIKCKLSDQVFHLMDLPKYLSLHYQYGTYKKSFLDANRIRYLNSYIHHGKLAIFIEGSGKIHALRDTRELAGGINISYSDVLINKRSVSVWNIEKDESTRKEELRRLRICLSKIHCIREGMINCFSYLEQLSSYDEISISKIEYQFNMVIKHLKDRLNRHNSDIIDILDLAFNYDNQINGIIWDEYIEKCNYFISVFNDFQAIEKVRKSLMEKGVNVNISDSTIISGSPGASATTISGSPGSSATTASTTLSNDIKSILSLLSVIAPQLKSLDMDNDEKEGLTDDIDVIKQEITKEEPKQIKLKKATANIKDFIEKASAGALLTSGLITNLQELIQKLEPFIKILVFK